MLVVIYRGLVYPIPEVGGLGVHSTVDMEGNVRFGPDVEWVSEIDYVVGFAFYINSSICSYPSHHECSPLLFVTVLLLS